MNRRAFFAVPLGLLGAEAALSGERDAHEFIMRARAQRAEQERVLASMRRKYEIHCGGGAIIVWPDSGEVELRSAGGKRYRFANDHG